jgi:hypothetical protein
MFAHLDAQTQSKKTLEKIAKKPYWSKLIHFEDNKSIINTKDFFLASNTDLELELKATLKAFKNNPATKCKYPARYKWLNSLNLVADIDAQCLELEKFLESNFTKISIVYSTERYSAAASLFGHVLLKLDSKNISNAIEYTAKVPAGTNPFSYAYNGLFGGFVSKYNYFSFYAKDYEARDEEFRDLVVYELDLKNDEIENILLHLYEVKDTTQSYYFTTRNCSSELIKLLDFADYDAKNTSASSLFVLPVEVITSQENKANIKSVKLYNSKLKHFDKNYKRLDAKEQKILKSMAFYKRSVSSVLKDKKISKDSKDKLVKTALLYFNAKVQNKDISAKIPSKILALSRYKNKNSLNTNTNYTTLEKNPISNAFYRVGLGYLYKHESYATLSTRYLYKNRFDLLDALVKNGSVEFLDLKLRANEKLSLEYFTLIHLASMPISSEFFSEPTKELSIGAKRLFFDDELYKYGEYALGKRMLAAKDLSYSLSVYGGVYRDDETLYALGLKMHLEYKLVSKFLLRLGGDISTYRYNSFKNTTDASTAFMQTHIKSSKNTLLGAKVEYHNNQDDYVVSSLYCNYSF